MRGVQGGRPGLALWLRKPPGRGTGSGRVSCRRSPCADLLCAGLRGVSQGLPWCSIIDICTSESRGMGAVPSKQYLVPSCGGPRVGATRVHSGVWSGCEKGRFRHPVKGGAAQEGLGHITHTPMVCNFPAAALVLCTEVQQEISGLSPFRFCIQSAWGFPIWFHSDNPALESRGLGCRHRETCRSQQQLCWDGCDTFSTCQSFPSSSPGKQEPAAEQKRAQSTKTPGRCCTAVQHGLL